MMRNHLEIGPLSWVLIYVHDLARVRPFYEEELGLEVRDANQQFVNYRTGKCTLELMTRTDNAPFAGEGYPPAGPGRVLVSFKVDDTAKLVASLAERGLHPRHGIRSTVSADNLAPAGRLAQYEDPEGNVIEFCDEDFFEDIESL